jgi:hypothetical protein
MHTQAVGHDAISDAMTKTRLTLLRFDRPLIDARRFFPLRPFTSAFIGSSLSSCLLLLLRSNAHRAQHQFGGGNGDTPA